MGANRYWCENSFGAIKIFLWIKIGHFLAIFLLFWAFLVTLMAVATTILLTLGIGCTKRLVRHMGWWYGTIFALLSHIAMLSRPSQGLQACLGVRMSGAYILPSCETSEMMKWWRLLRLCFFLLQNVCSTYFDKTFMPLSPLCQKNLSLKDTLETLSPFTFNLPAATIKLQHKEA